MAGEVVIGELEEEAGGVPVAEHGFVALAQFVVGVEGGEEVVDIREGHGPGAGIAEGGEEAASGVGQREGAKGAEGGGDGFASVDGGHGERMKDE